MVRYCLDYLIKPRLGSSNIYDFYQPCMDGVLVLKCAVLHGYVNTID